METARRHLIVDGHNVLHAWGWMAGPEATARGRLIEVLREFCDGAQWEVSVVFDSRAGSTTSDLATSVPDFRVIFAAAGLTADAVIGRLVAAETNPTRCIVVSGDNLVCENVRAAGSDCQSPGELHAWMERERATTRRRLNSRAAAQRKVFGNKLPL